MATRLERKKRDKEILLLASTGLQPIEIATVVDLSPQSISRICRKHGMGFRGKDAHWRMNAKMAIARTAQKTTAAELDSVSQITASLVPRTINKNKVRDQKIMTLARSGMPMLEIAAIFGLSRPRVSRICNLHGIRRYDRSPPGGDGREEVALAEEAHEPTERFPPAPRIEPRQSTGWTCPVCGRGCSPMATYCDHE